MPRKKKTPTTREGGTLVNREGLVSTTPVLKASDRLGAQAVRRESLLSSPILHGFEDRIAMGAMGLLEDITPQERKYMTQVAADHLLGRSDEQQGIKDEGVNVTLRINGRLFDPVTGRYDIEDPEYKANARAELMALDAKIKAERLEAKGGDE